MNVLALTAALAVLAPSLAWGHGGGLDPHGCHTDATKSEYHCHQGTLKGRSYKSRDTMLTAHPELRRGDASAERAGKTENTAGERAKKEKAEDKLKDGDKTTTSEYAKDAKKKTSSPSR
jgi:hypothetical protein